MTEQPASRGGQVADGPGPDGVDADTATASAALAGIQTAFAADDYRMDVATTTTAVLLKVRPGPESCAECLVPAHQLAAMARTALADSPLADREIIVDYPPEAQK